MTASSMSKGFFEFVKSIGEAKSKQEEDRIIEKELIVLKSKMGGKNVASRQMREFLIRMVYVEMLGHDASFGHIHAVKLTKARKLFDKRVGYLACSLVLHKDHELMLLLVGGLQTDLQSQNQLEVATSLVVSCKLINDETIPAVLPLVNKLLSHTESTIRKKAVMVLHRFYELAPHAVSDISDKAKRMLCDKDPSVMGASLHLLYDLMEKDVNSYKDLVSSFVSILKQVIEHRLPKEYDYHRMPAPWVQIKLLQILSLLGTADKSASESMYEVLHEVMRRADIGINVGYAIIYECVRTVTTIIPNQQLLGEAAKCTSRFITSENHNLKYLGINALASIVQVNPSAANEHQMVVIDCLEDKDETLRRKTLDLLFRMTNENNVNVICTKLLQSLKDSVDIFLRVELIEKITTLAENLAPDTIWYIETMSEVFELGGDLVPIQIAHNFMKHCALGIQQAEEDDDNDEDVAQYCADFFYEQLERKKIPKILLKVISWVLGEYGHVCTGESVTKEIEQDENKQDDENIIEIFDIIVKLWETIESKTSDFETRLWSMSATAKLCTHLDNIPNKIIQIITKYQKSVNSDLQQMAHELLEMVKEKNMMESVFKDSTITDDIKVDSSLKFLNIYVEESIKNGAKKYSPPDDMEDDYGIESKGPKLEFFKHKETNDKSLLDKSNIQQINNNNNNYYDNNKQINSNNDNNQINNNDYNINNNKQKHIDTGLKVKKNVWNLKDMDDSNSDSEQEIIDTNIKTKTTHYSERHKDPSPSNTPPITTNSLESNRDINTTSRPAPKRELTKKEQEARALFFGDQTIKRRPTRRRIKTKNRNKRNTQRNQEKTNTTNNDSNINTKNNNDDDDLLGFGTNKSNQNVSNTQPSKQNSGDILDDLFSTGNETTTTTTTTTTNTNNSGDFLDDFMSTPTTSNNQNKNNDDIMNSLFDNNNNSNNNNNNNSNLLSNITVPRGFAAMSDLKIKFAAIPRLPPSDQIIASNSLLQLSYFKLYKSQQTLLCLFFSNISNNNLNNIQYSIQSSNLNNGVLYGINLSESIPKPKLSNAKSGSLSLNSNKTACQIINLGINNPSSVILPDKLNVNIMVNNQKLSAVININLSDVMRPVTLNTNQFGQNWSKVQGTQFQINRTNCNNLNDYVNKIKQLQLHHIQTIQIECIASGQIRSTSNSNMVIPVLVHAKRDNNGIFTIMVRSVNMNISKSYGIELRNLLTL